jgi:chromosome segregation ATPase
MEKRIKKLVFEQKVNSILGKSINPTLQKKERKKIILRKIRTHYKQKLKQVQELYEKDKEQSKKIEDLEYEIKKIKETVMNYDIKVNCLENALNKERDYNKVLKEENNSLMKRNQNLTSEKNELFNKLTDAIQKDHLLVNSSNFGDPEKPWAEMGKNARKKMLKKNEKPLK